MDKKTVFVKTDKGEAEVGGQSDVLFGDIKRILMLVDDQSTVADITKRAPPSLRDALQKLLQELDDGGYVRDMRAPVNVPEKPALKMSTPAFKMATPKATLVPQVVPSARATPLPSSAPASVNVPPVAAKPKAMSMPDMTMPVMAPAKQAVEEPAKVNKKSELDFSFLTGGATSTPVADKSAIDKAMAESQLKAKQEVERKAAVQEAASKAAKLKAYEEAKVKAKLDVAAKAKLEAEMRAKNEAGSAKQKAEQEAQNKRVEQDSAKNKMEAEMRIRIEAEARARLAAEAKAKQDIEAARLKAESEAAKVRLELETVKAKAELEMRIRIEAEARIKAETEARLKLEAEAVKLKLEKERAELEAAKAKVEAETRSRIEAEARIKAEVEARLQQEAAAERIRKEKERAELEAARVKAETEIKYRLEAEAKIKAEAEEAERQRAAAEVRIRAEVEGRLKNEEAAQHAAAQAAARKAATPVAPPPPPVKEVYVDPAEKLRKSFVESFGKQAEIKKDPSTTAGFKLDNFSFLNTGKMPAAQIPESKATAPVSGKSKENVVAENRSSQITKEQALKAEQDAARLKAENEAASRKKAEQDSIRLEAERAEYRLKTEKEEARVKAEAEAKLLTNQQSKQWEEAQQRAASQAQAEQELKSKQAAEAKIKAQQKPRSPRKSLPIGKIIAGLLTLIVGAVFALPYVLPMDEYIAPLQAEISSQINQPVKIEKIHVALLPLPQLSIENLVVGGSKELSAKSVIVHFDFSALFAATKLINKMELSNVNVEGESLDKVMSWVRMAGSSEKYPVSNMALKNLRVNTAEVKLPALNGNVNFDTQGKFTKAELKTEDEKYSLEFEPQQNNLQLVLNIRDTTLPIFSGTKFNDFSATGLIGNGEFVISDIFAHIHGGTLTGKGRLGWFNGWKLDSQLKVKSFELQSMFPNFGISGQIYGDVSVSTFASVLSQLDNDPHLEGTFEAKDGVINKLDIDTVARFGARQGGGGRTSYEELNGTLKADVRNQRVYFNKISAGSISGSGLFEVDSNHEVNGRLLIDVKGDTRGAIPMQLSGSLLDPSIKAGR